MVQWSFIKVAQSVLPSVCRRHIAGSRAVHVRVIASGDHEGDDSKVHASRAALVRQETSATMLNRRIRKAH